MTPQRILLIQGHPDAVTSHLGHALADAYAHGAESVGHVVRRAEVAKLDFPLLRSQQKTLLRMRRPEAPGQESSRTWRNASRTARRASINWSTPSPVSADT